MDNINFIASQAKHIYQYKGLKTNKYIESAQWYE